jgi:hypothetical protein
MKPFIPNDDVHPRKVTQSFFQLLWRESQVKNAQALKHLYAVAHSA